MTILLTRHAVERYREFWMIDRPTATDMDASLILQDHIGQAVKQGYRTVRGDQVWRIEALGIELVVKPHRTNPEYSEVVTVLPPPRLRGLTPMQAERVEVSLADVKQRELSLRAEVDGPTGTGINSTDTPAQKAEKNQLRERADDRSRELKQELAILTAQRETLSPILKTMRQELAVANNESRLRTALKLALRFIADLGPGDDDQMRRVLELTAAIQAIEPGLLSPKFLRGDV